MEQYHKINSIFLRDPNNKYRTFLHGQWAQPEYGLLNKLDWVGTEKIDGTNIRIIWDGENVRFAGKSDNAQIPAPLFDYLKNHFTIERLTDGLEGPVTLYGEGFGGKIQKGSAYSQDQRFILFDVWAQHPPLGIWLAREVVVEIACELDIPVVSEIYRGPLSGAINIVKAGFQSVVSCDPKAAEGLVLRPASELRDRMGRRVITKIKTRDFE